MDQASGEAADPSCCSSQGGASEVDTPRKRPGPLTGPQAGTATWPGLATRCLQGLQGELGGLGVEVGFPAGGIDQRDGGVVTLEVDH